MENEKNNVISFDGIPAQNNGIVVDDGMEEVPISNKLGRRIGVFYIRPTDVGIVDRYNDFVKDADSILEPLNQTGINPDGTAKDNDQQVTDALKEAKIRLSEKLDTLFGGNFSEAFFGCMNPFSIVNGRFYCETAIDVVGEYIGQRFEHETSKMQLSQKKVDKYTHGYKSGKHRNGGQRKRGNRR